LLDRKEIAAFLKISLVTLNRWTKLGLPCHKLDRKVYFIKTEVMDYLKKNKLKKIVADSTLFGR
jgi:predicted site-specific integrase-resolvase